MDAVITIHITKEDKDLIKKAAEAVRLNPSAFCRYIVLLAGVAGGYVGGIFFEGGEE